MRIELLNPTFSSGKAPEKLLFTEVSWEGIGGDVAEVAEEIIRETRKELDIEIITNFLEGRIKNNKKNQKAFIFL